MKMRMGLCMAVALMGVGCSNGCKEATLKEGDYDVVESYWASYCSAVLNEADTITANMDVLAALLLSADALELDTRELSAQYTGDCLYLFSPDEVDTLDNFTITTSRIQADHESLNGYVLQPAEGGECDVWYHGHRVMRLRLKQ